MRLLRLGLGGLGLGLDVPRGLLRGGDGGFRGVLRRLGPFLRGVRARDGVRDARLQRGEPRVHLYPRCFVRVVPIFPHSCVTRGGGLRGVGSSQRVGRRVLRVLRVRLGPRGSLLGRYGCFLCGCGGFLGAPRGGLRGAEQASDPHDRRLGGVVGSIDLRLRLCEDLRSHLFADAADGCLDVRRDDGRDALLDATRHRLVDRGGVVGGILARVQQAVLDERLSPSHGFQLGLQRRDAHGDVLHRGGGCKVRRGGGVRRRARAAARTARGLRRGRRRRRGGSGRRDGC